MKKEAVLVIGAGIAGIQASIDLAGVSRLQMSPDFHIIRVMCSARVAPEWVIKTLSDGTDGVIGI